MSLWNFLELYGPQSSWEKRPMSIHTIESTDRGWIQFEKQDFQPCMIVPASKEKSWNIVKHGDSYRLHFEFATIELIFEFDRFEEAERVLKLLSNPQEN
jgi:hypothetical protein